MSEQIQKRKPGRPRGSTKVKKEQNAKRQDLALTERRLEIGDLYLAGFNVKQIADRLATSEEYVSEQLRLVQTHFSDRLADLGERLAALNVARLEHIMSMYYPDATRPISEDPELETDDIKSRRKNALTVVFRTMDREFDWYKAVKAAGEKTGNTEGGLIQIDKFEQTIIAGGELFSRVQTAMQDDWLDMASMPVEELYKQLPSVTNLQDRLTDLEEIVGGRADDDAAEEASYREIADDPEADT